VGWAKDKAMFSPLPNFFDKSLEKVEVQAWKPKIIIKARG
jgi:hypothetical protein